MSALDPTAPSQPSLDTAYDQPANPAQSTLAEERANNSTAASQQRSDPTQETRRQNDVLSGGDKDQNSAQPSSLAYGATSTATSTDDPTALGSNPASNLEGEQMRAPGEGDIASAQDTKHGFGEQGDLAAGLDAKKEMQQDKLRERREEESWGEGGGGVDVGKAMEGKEGVAFVGAGSNNGNGGDMRAEGQRQGMGGGMGMQTGHGQV